MGRHASLTKSTGGARDQRSGLAGVADRLHLAGRHRLTVCDASYLQLAADVEAELATLDRGLARATRAEGVGVVASV
jgi:predicted nucleic acid-binding protein